MRCEHWMEYQGVGLNCSGKGGGGRAMISLGWTRDGSRVTAGLTSQLSPLL
jgi:hypothetical protein